MNHHTITTRRLAAPALIALALAACGEGAANEAGTGLQTSTAEVRDIVSSVAATGTIEPIKVIEVKSQASGEILEMPVELGDYVEKGAILVRIDPRDVRNAFEQAKADLEVAEARYMISQRQLDRTSTLHDSAVVSDSELETAILENANAKAALTRAETNLELAQDRLNDVVVRAPLAGTVVQKNVEEGQVITGTREVTGGTVILRMADLNEVQVRTLVDETDIGRIEPGLVASIEVEAYPDREFNGNVLKVEPQAVVEQNVTMFAVLTRIRNENDLLRPGMNADVEVVVGRRDSVLSVRNGAVKTVDEARQLVSALGMDQELLAARVEAPAEEADRSDEPGRAPGGEATAGDAEPAESADPLIAQAQRMEGMSRDERMQFFQSLSAADRQRLMDYFRTQREQQAAAERSDPGRPKPAFVFVETNDGLLTLKPVQIGLSDWERTEVLAGLEEGDEVVEVPLSLIQQRDILQRVQARTGVAGMRRN
jgi:HlyD family secretion protein